MNYPKYFVNNDSFVDNCCHCCEEEKYQKIPHKSNFFEHNPIINYSPIIRLADLNKEVNILQATLPEYKIIYDRAENRNYKIIVYGVVDTVLNLKDPTIMNGSQIKQILVKKDSFLILNFTVSYNKDRIVILETDLDQGNAIFEIAKILEDIINIKNDVSDNQEKIAQNTFNIDNLQNATIVIQANQSAFDKDIENIKENISEIVTDLSKTNNEISIIKNDIVSKVEKAKEIAQKAKEKIDAYILENNTDKATIRSDFETADANIQAYINTLEVLINAVSNKLDTLAKLHADVTIVSLSNINADLNGTKKKNGTDGFGIFNRIIKAEQDIISANESINENFNALNSTNNLLKENINTIQDNITTIKDINAKIVVPSLANINADLNGTKKPSGDSGFGIFTRIEELEQNKTINDENITALENINAQQNQEITNLWGSAATGGVLGVQKQVDDIRTDLQGNWSTTNATIERIDSWDEILFKDGIGWGGATSKFDGETNVVGALIKSIERINALEDDVQQIDSQVLHERLVDVEAGLIFPENDPKIPVGQTNKTYFAYNASDDALATILYKNYQDKLQSIWNIMSRELEKLGAAPLSEEERALILDVQLGSN